METTSKNPVNSLYTIGHSNHPIEHVLHLLSLHRISAVADVRSIPFSRYTPQFNQGPLQKAVREAGMEYVFLGKEFGARSEDPACYEKGKLHFGLVAQTELFQNGLARIRKGVETYRIALLCAEKDPITCHRMILVCRHLKRHIPVILHILEDGRTEENPQAERRLRNSLGIQETHLFATLEELTDEAYDIQGKRIAHEEKPQDEKAHEEKRDE
ncbi:MAG: DUF488 domain-containing protein [Deltaproteobacteria bacterium]|nr:DUF488 domain-containing protein [Deltaproteobacteria bacterium]